MKAKYSVLLVVLFGLAVALGLVLRSSRAPNNSPSNSTSNTSNIFASNASSLASMVTVEDAEACTGLSTYKEDVFKVENDWVAAVRNVGPNGLAYSSTDWQKYALAVQNEISGLKSITPPAFARPWHDAYVAREELLLKVAKMAAKSGLLSMTVLKDEDDELAAKIADGLDASSSRCADFRTFASDVDLIVRGIDGTPTPTEAAAFEASLSSCDGLGAYRSKMLKMIKTAVTANKAILNGRSANDLDSPDWLAVAQVVGGI